MSLSFDLLHLTHLRFRGPDAERYLSGQITQQISDLSGGQSRYTFVCDAKGRILFDAHVRKDEEGFLLSVAGGSRDDLFARMDRYLIADDCELVDESPRWGIRHTLLDQREEGTVNRFGQWGRDDYLADEGLLELLQADEAELENRRLKHGVARLQDVAGALPAETGLESEAVSFHKGCYLGQEVISRMKRAGKTNRKLVPLLLDGTTTELPLTFHADGSDKALLEVTSVGSQAVDDGYPALGYLSSRCDPGAPLRSHSGLSVLGLSVLGLPRLT